MQEKRKEEEEQMDRFSQMQEKQRKQRCRDKFLMREKFEMCPMKKSKKETTIDDKLQDIQEQQQPNSDPSKLFERLKLSDFSYFLNDSVERKVCEGCNKKSKIYCADCLRLLQGKEFIPQVKLPFKLTIVHHDNERIRKSSALPSKLLVEENGISECEVLHYPTQTIPEFDLDTTLILYPHKNSRRVLELDQKTMERIKNVVAIDCTWNQTNGILKSLGDRPYQFVRLEEYNTTFWRYQFHSPSCLATIEAIYYFFTEFEKSMSKFTINEKEYVYDGKYDNLLYFYAWNYQVIQDHYKQNTSQKFNKIKNYIKYDATDTLPIQQQQSEKNSQIQQEQIQNNKLSPQHLDTKENHDEIIE